MCAPTRLAEQYSIRDRTIYRALNGVGSYSGVVICRGRGRREDPSRARDRASSIGGEPDAVTALWQDELLARIAIAPERGRAVFRAARQLQRRSLDGALRTRAARMSTGSVSVIGDIMMIPAKTGRSGPASYARGPKILLVRSQV